MQGATLRSGFKWGIHSILLSALISPIWIEFSNFVSTILVSRPWTGFVSSNAPILWIGVPILVAIITSIPFMLGALTLSMVIKRIERDQVSDHLYGLGAGLIVGVVLGITLMSLFYWAMIQGGQGPFNRLGDWVEFILWVFWCGALFSFIGWRMSSQYQKLIMTTASSKHSQ